MYEKNGIYLACSTLQYMQTGKNLIEAIKSIHKLGYEAVEITMGEGYIEEEEPEIPDKENLRNVLEISNLKVSSVLTNLCWGYGESKTKSNKKFLEKVVNFANELEVDHLVANTGYWPTDLDRSISWDNIIKNLSWVSRMCTERDLKLTLEVVAAWPGRDSETFLRIKREVGDNFYANIDPSNYGLSGEDPVKVIYKLKELIGGVHLKDSKHKGVIQEELTRWIDKLTREYAEGTNSGGRDDFVFEGAKPEWTLLGKGDVDFKNFLNALKEIKYKGALVVEYEGNFSGYTDNAEEASKKSLDYIKPIFESL